MKFSEHQLQAIATREHSIVSAGAGAGKTSVLVERYLSLLNNDQCGVENILCLTFTRKAAGEMYERVHGRLLNESENPLYRRQFERFERARITTIDGFCNSILRPYLSDFGYPGTVSVVSREMDRELNQFCLGFLSTKLASPGITRLLEHFPFHSLVEDLFMPLIKTPRASVFAKGVFHDVHRKRLIELVNRTLSELHDSLGGILALREDLGNAPGGKLDQALKILDRAFDQLDRIPRVLTDPEPQIIHEMLPVLLLLKSGLSGFTSSSAKAARPWKDYKDVQGRVLEQLLIPSLIILSEDEVYEDMYRVLEDFGAKASDFKRRNGILFFQDLLHMARHVLMEYPDFADVLRREIRFIMIDEFQDNNEDQKDLLFLLAAQPGYREKRVPGFQELRSGVLYFVGDQKQSIYRFRNADVSVFKSLSGELPPGGRSISLSENYRSSPALINGFNNIFPGIMAGERGFEAEYEHLNPGLKQHGKSRFELLLGFKDDHGGENLSASEHEAHMVAEKILQIVNSEKYLIPDEETQHLRRPAYEDIVVLYKTGSLQNQLEAMFRRFSIPYTADSTRSLFHDAPAYDIHSFLKFCLYPEDRISFASFLRSPMLALGDESISRLISSVHNTENPALLLNEGMAEILSDEDERRRLTGGIHLWNRCRTMIDRISHQELLGFIWRESGYEEFMRSDHYRRGFLEYYDYLLEFFEQYEDAPLAELLEDLERYLGSNERAEDLSIFRETGGGVQLMTIHKSKGLEFPIVFLVNTNSRGRADTSASKPFVQTPEGTPLLYGGISEEVVHRWFPGDKHAGKKFRNPVVRELQARTRMEENAETRRLLYVALTRARQHIVITADNIPLNGKKASGTDGAAGIADRRHSTDQEEENLYDLVESALQLSRSNLGEMEPGSWRSQALGENSVELDLYRSPPISASRISSRKSSIGAADPLSGPPAPLRMPKFPPYSISVTRLQNYVHDLANSGEHLPGRPGLTEESVAVSESASPDRGDSAELGTLIHRIIEMNLNFRQNGGGEQAETAGTGQAETAGTVQAQEGQGGAGEARAEQAETAGTGQSGTGQAGDPHWPLGQLEQMFWDGHSPEEHKKLLPTAEKICGAFFQSGLYERICSSANRETELPFTLFVGDVYIQGQIDLLLMEDERLLILDFKSGEEVNPGDYSLQLDIYRLAVEHMREQLDLPGNAAEMPIEAGIVDIRQSRLLLLPSEYSHEDIESLIRDYRRTVLTD